MSKHTKGPWEVGFRALSVTAKDGQMKICDIRGWGHLTGHGAMNLSEDEGVEIQTANANLIAAAPDMYEALKAFLNDEEDARQIGWKALDKAEGRTEDV